MAFLSEPNVASGNLVMDISLLLYACQTPTSVALRIALRAGGGLCGLGEPGMLAWQLWWYWVNDGMQHDRHVH